MSKHGWLADSREKWLSHLSEKKRNRLATRRSQRLRKFWEDRGWNFFQHGPKWKRLPSPRIETARSQCWRDNFRERKCVRQTKNQMKNQMNAITDYVLETEK